MRRFFNKTRGVECFFTFKIRRAGRSGCCLHGKQTARRKISFYRGLQKTPLSGLARTGTQVCFLRKKHRRRRFFDFHGFCDTPLLQSTFLFSAVCVPFIHGQDAYHTEGGRAFRRVPLRHIGRYLQWV